MSSERGGLTEFRTALSGDPGLQEELRARALETEADVAAFAAECGYSFSAEELKSLAELTEAELDNVTGGAAFVKYDGVDGESRDASHDRWIDVLSIAGKWTGPT